MILGERGQRRQGIGPRRRSPAPAVIADWSHLEQPEREHHAAWEQDREDEHSLVRDLRAKVPGGR